MIIDISRRERKKEALRLQIVQTAMALFRAKGFAQTRMEKIADESDIAKATLYKYFPVKEAIIAAYWKDKVQQKEGLLPSLFEKFPNTNQRLQAVFLSAVQQFKQEPEFARIQFSYQFLEIAKQPDNQTQRSGFESFLDAILAHGQQEGDIRRDIASSMMANQLLFLFTSTCLLWFSNTQLFPIEERLQQVINLFIEGAKYE
ncbi:TetR/AcrR family transcriptional regulator [Mariprofundus ferrooxydans]|nr:TetR/AcrR family transcriptional regulator [Mariprofundus ferrooxydans]